MNIHFRLNSSNTVHLLLIHISLTVLLLNTADAAHYEVSFKSWQNKYFVSELNGGTALNANRTSIGAWEKMRLNDLDDGRCIRHGETITINSGNNWYWHPSHLVGDSLQNQNDLTASFFFTSNILQAPDEIKFRIFNHSDNNRCLGHGDLISLQSMKTGKYVVAESDGNVRVNRDVIGPWEKMTVIIHDELDVNPDTNFIEDFFAENPEFDESFKVTLRTIEVFLIETGLSLGLQDFLDDNDIDYDLSGLLETEDLIYSAIQELIRANADVILGYHYFRDEIPFGNTHLPQTDRVEWLDHHELVQGTVDNYANYTLSENAWNSESGKKTYSRVILAKLANAELEGATSAPDDARQLIEWAAQQGPWSIPGSSFDYDFAEVNLITILWRFHHLLGQDKINELLSLLVSDGTSGLTSLELFIDMDESGFGNLSLFSNMDALGIPFFPLIRETENHILKTEGTRFLKNKWLRENGNNSPEYDNKTNGVGEFLEKFLDHTIKATLYEFNSMPYAESTLMALLNLEAYADGKVQTKARELLDTIMFKYAIGSLNGYRWAPMRRKHELRHYSTHDDDTTSLARGHLTSAEPASNYSHWNSGNRLKARSGITLYTALLPYRIPRSTLTLMQSTDKSYFATLGRGKLSSPELYSAGPGYLLSAGGVVPDTPSTYSFCEPIPGQASCSDQVLRSTTLILDSLNVEAHRYGFRMSGGNLQGQDGVIYNENTVEGSRERELSYNEYNNTCVYENFACSAGRVWTPSKQALNNNNFSMYCEDELSNINLLDLSISPTEKNLNQWCVYSTPSKNLQIAIYSSNTLGVMALFPDRNSEISPTELITNLRSANADINALTNQFNWPSNISGAPNGSINYDPHSDQELWAISGVDYTQDQFNNLGRDFKDWPQINLVSGNLLDHSAPIPDSTTDRLSVGQSLENGNTLLSKNHQYRLIMQNDGNLVIYKAGGTPIWASNTAGTDAKRLVLQGDGNLVLYNSSGIPIWATNNLGTNRQHLIMQNDGNLVLYTNNGSAVWATGTNGR